MPRGLELVDGPEGQEFELGDVPGRVKGAWGETGDVVLDQRGLGLRDGLSSKCLR